MIIKINNNKFKVKTVITPKDTESGMMGKKFDSSYNGMLFLMDDGEHCFWMKNCIIPLDIIFIDNDVITKIHHNCQPMNNDSRKNYCGEGNFILEVKGGTCKELEIKKGDVVTFPL